MMISSGNATLALATARLRPAQSLMSTKPELPENARGGGTPVASAANGLEEPSTRQAETSEAGKDAVWPRASSSGGPKRVVDIKIEDSETTRVTVTSYSDGSADSIIQQKAAALSPDAIKLISNIGDRMSPAILLGKGEVINIIR